MRCSKKMAGVVGLEPTNDGTKTRCLTNLATPQYALTSCNYYQASSQREKGQGQCLIQRLIFGKLRRRSLCPRLLAIKREYAGA